jgi:anti-sigma-K factor RskA
MTPVDDNGPAREGPEPGGDDIAAAEYVVGVLSGEERRDVAARIEADADFARLVEAWEARLSPMADAYRSVAPAASVKAAIDRRLFSAPATRPATERPRLWQSLGFWRSLAGAALLLLFVAVAVQLLPSRLSVPGTHERYIASIAPENSDVSYLAYYDPATDRLSLSRVSGERSAGHDFELWVIEGQQKPVSLGTVPAGDRVEIKVGSGMAAKLGKGGVLAISLEPSGGSPTGQPTGPVVAAGGLKQI